MAVGVRRGGATEGRRQAEQYLKGNDVRLCPVRTTDHAIGPIQSYRFGVLARGGLGTSAAEADVLEETVSDRDGLIRAGVNDGPVRARLGGELECPVHGVESRSRFRH